MSSALAIAGVTQVLRDRLNDGLVNHDVTGTLGSKVFVSVVPPDRVVPENGTEASQLNLFLYQVTPNTAWSNRGYPAYDASGRHRLTNPPLALDLHYLLSAYSGGDLHAEILLGYAMQLMHEFPVLTREMIHTALTPSPAVGAQLPPALQALSSCGLADQVEALRITPEPLGTEEISKIWTATQSGMRPTAAYRVSVVLIEATRPTRSPLPVLTRGPVDSTSGRERGIVVTPDMIPPLPAISAVLPAGNQPVASLGEVIRLEGHHLNGTNREVVFVNERYAVNEALAATGPSHADHLDVLLPVARANDFPVGVYEVHGRLLPAGETRLRETNRIGCVVAPRVTNLPQSIGRDAAGTAHLSLDFVPAARPGQRVTLFVGQREIPAATFSGSVTTLNFDIEDAAVGTFLVRLRVDGVDSTIVDRTTEPPTFFNRTVAIS